MPRRHPPPAAATAVMCLVASMVPWLAAPAVAQEFAAEVVRTEPGGGAARPAGTLKVSNGRVRFETGTTADGYFLVRPGGGAWLVRPAARVAMAAGQWSALSLLVAVDPDRPCAAWQALAGDGAGEASDGSNDLSKDSSKDLGKDGRAWRCERRGGDATAIRYDATSPQGRHYVAVVDPQLRFPVRIESDDGSVLAVGGVVRAPQPEALFVLPATYRMFSVQGLIERMKQADVWGASTPQR